MQKVIRKFSKELTCNSVLNADYPDDKSHRVATEIGEVRIPKTVDGWSSVRPGVKFLADMAEVSWEYKGKSGTYIRVDGLSILEQAKQNGAASMTRDEMIARQVALKAAVEWLAGKQATVDDVIAAAKRFNDFLVDSEEEIDFDEFIEEAKEVLDAKEE